LNDSADGQREARILESIRAAKQRYDFNLRAEGSQGSTLTLRELDVIPGQEFPEVMMISLQMMLSLRVKLDIARIRKTEEVGLLKIENRLVREKSGESDERHNSGERIIQDLALKQAQRDAKLIIIELRTAEAHARRHIKGLVQKCNFRLQELVQLRGPEGVSEVKLRAQKLERNEREEMVGLITKLREIVVARIEVRDIDKLVSGMREDHDLRASQLQKEKANLAHDNDNDIVARSEPAFYKKQKDGDQQKSLINQLQTEEEEKAQALEKEEIRMHENQLLVERLRKEVLRGEFKIRKLSREISMQMLQMQS
jgi:hypothetical protein